MAIVIDVTCSGPLFDGRAAQYIAEGTRAARDDLVARGLVIVRALFAASIRFPTGRFAGSITTTEQSVTYSTAGHHKVYTMPVVVEDPATDTVVTTDLATYGPWLEGTGSRNQTTRFKGYFGYRRTAQQLDGEAQEIADKALAPYIARCNE